ncbi:hypothetical protein EI94DRAFT_187598 [Lactarius quietus]|nr:hypothetical protein EI94DRAFT_187598 [Lactarius quietus]
MNAPRWLVRAISPALAHVSALAFHRRVIGSSSDSQLHKIHFRTNSSAVLMRIVVRAIDGVWKASENTQQLEDPRREFKATIIKALTGDVIGDDRQQKSGYCLLVLPQLKLTTAPSTCVTAIRCRRSLTGIPVFDTHQRQLWNSRKGDTLTAGSAPRTKPHLLYFKQTDRRTCSIVYRHVCANLQLLACFFSNVECTPRHR